uniref:uncharacterized protein LOC125906577 n=1 Tax=Anopheles coluzzii TaxID=1518534 RepID=UPI0020FFB55B|nr:uncharacterized protein LOC125906577 [Anopheles coluzzii]
MKCTCEGEFSPLSNTTTFKSINAPLRTDKEFRAGAYPDHVKVISPLLEIPDIDIITDVIISESLHLFYLGILKRLLFGWRDGKLGKCYKWSGMQCDSVSEHLVGIELPSEIHRRFRRLDELKNWKGTELASFLHYAGLVVLKVLPSEAYEHFLLLFCAVTMLSSNEFKKNWHVAGKMLETFVIQYGQIYGEQYLTSNVHNLLHVLDEVRHFGPLPSLSAFRYENKLQFIKKSLRGTNRPLAQAANRNIELQNFFTIANNTVPSYPLTKNNKTNDLLITSGFLLQNNNRNGWFLTLDKQIIRYQSFVFDSETEIRIEGFVLPGNIDYFQYPIKSNHLYVFRGNRRDLRKKSSMFKLSDIKCKLAAVTTNDGDEHVFVPLLHTLR